MIFAFGHAEQERIEVDVHGYLPSVPGGTRNLGNGPWLDGQEMNCVGDLEDVSKKKWSERQDLNLRRLGPKPSALPG